MALSMAELAKDMQPEVVVGCQFLKRIRSGHNSIGKQHPPDVVPGMSKQARFLDIVGFMMTCLRSQHAPENQSWPQMSPDQVAKIQSFTKYNDMIRDGTIEYKDVVDNMVKAGEITCADGNVCPLSGAMAILDEAEALQHSAGLPQAAKLWVLALRARLLCIAKQFEAAGVICEEIAKIVVEDPEAMQDPFSLYACYSIAFALQNLENSGGAFVSLWQLLRSMAMIWPLAATLLDHVQAPAKAYAVCSSGESCVGKVEGSSLSGMPPATSAECSKAMKREEQEVQVIVEERELKHKEPHKNMGDTIDMDILSWGEVGDIDMSFQGEAVAASDSDTVLTSNDGSESSGAQPTEAYHDREEWAPLLTPEEEAHLGSAIKGIIDDDVDMDSLLAGIEVDIGDI